MRLNKEQRSRLAGFLEKAAIALLVTVTQEKDPSSAKAAVAFVGVLACVVVSVWVERKGGAS